MASPAAILAVLGCVGGMPAGQQAISTAANDTVQTVALIGQPVSPAEGGGSSVLPLSSDLPVSSGEASTAVMRAGRDGSAVIHGGAPMRLSPIETRPPVPSPTEGSRFGAASPSSFDSLLYGDEGQPGTSDSATPPGMVDSDLPSDTADQVGSEPKGLRSWSREMWCDTKLHVWADHSNYYGWPTYRDMGLALALAAPVANTAMDQHFQDWYQHDVRTEGTDGFATACKNLGEGKYMIPGAVGLALTGRSMADIPTMNMLGDFGDRTTRAYLVGAPPMLLMQVLLGGSRPGEIENGSYWRPFNDDNSVSGHTFMGAVPFITAAKMTDSRLLKSSGYILSTLAGWSRVNDDRHSLSQVGLGWWMGYLACRAVNDTEEAEQPITVVPLVTPQMSGVGAIYRW